MAFIYETKNFIVESHERPFVSRTDGGHIRIIAKDKDITDRTKLSLDQAHELMELTMIVGKALQEGMNKRGVPVVKVNYHDMGNWAFKSNKRPILHIHVFGRAKNAKEQPFPEAVFLPARETGFYDEFKPLNKEDVKVIRKIILKSF